MNIWIMISACSALGALVISFVGILVSRAVEAKIVGNDLMHISAKLEAIDKHVMNNGRRLDEYGERIAKIEGKLDII